MYSIRMIALAATLSAAAVATAAAADLTITVKDVRNASGLVRVGLFDSPATFMKPAQAKAALQAKATPGDVRFVIHDLPPGKYAVTSFHDENQTGKIEFGPLGIPLQGYGFSNNAGSPEGPPAFSQAAFDFNGKTDKAISFSLNY